MAVMGKTISADNAAKVAGEFQIVFTAFDNDRSGREATESVRKAIMRSNCRSPIVIDVIPIDIPGGKDPGDLPQDVADAILAKAIRRAVR